MSLRMRWFLVVGGLVALLVAAQGWWVRQLAGDLSDEADRVAVTVGRSMAHYFFADDMGHDNLAEVHVLDFSTPDALGELLDDKSPFGGEHSLHHKEVHHKEVRTVIECDDGDCREKRYENGTVKERLLPPEEVDSRSNGGGSYRTWIQSSSQHRDEAAAVEAEISLHLENEGDRRFLMLAGPNVEHRVDIPHSGVGERLEIFMRHMLLGSLGILAIGLLLAGFLAHRVTRPLEQLSASAQRVGEGEWGAQVAVQGSGELAQAIGAFNHMSSSLADLDARNRELGASQHLGEIGEIARGLAHSLRNPLNALGLSVDELAARSVAEGDAGIGRAGDEEAKELADAARKQIRRIDQSIRSFLALASQGGGVVTPVDLGQLVDDVALEALQDARGRVRLDVERLDEDELSIAGVEPELRAVLQALVVNAIEASPDGGQVTVRVERRDGSLCLLVDDEGPGLPPEVRQRLFTPHLSTKANGSGMGLFLAHRIACNRYAGHLELHDRQPTGTRVELRLADRVASLTTTEATAEVTAEVPPKASAQNGGLG